MENIGIFFAFLTAFCWTITALVFESAGKRVGSLSVNLIRLIIAFIFFIVYSLVFRSSVLPLDAPAYTWFWLGLSGLIGFVIGDLLLFQAFVLIGARVSMLIYSSVPPLTALIGWVVLGETLSLQSIVGMTITIIGISIVVLRRSPPPSDSPASKPLQGILLALGGSLGQAIGLVLSRYGAGNFDAFAATQIRSIAGIIGFVLIFFFIKGWKRFGKAIKNGPAMAKISVGSFFGPFLGVSLSLLAIQHTKTGIAATIIALVPILIIPPSVIIFKERISIDEVIGAGIAVAGVALLMLY